MDGARVRVVLVDDDERFGALVATVLVDDGIEVVATAVRVQGAAELVAATGPDVVVLDVVLPDGDGLDVVAQLEALGNTAPIVLFSSLFDLRTAAAAESMGLRYVEKADGVDALADAILAAARTADAR